jgi:hypothetical protein
MAARMNKPVSRRPKGKPQPRQKSKEENPDAKRFRVLIAVHRPRFRSRAERGVDFPGWLIRSLLNKEDPIGLINQLPPHILIISDDFGRQKNLGILKAVQRFREAGMKIVGVFEDPEIAETAKPDCDFALAMPWRTSDVRAVAARMFEEIKGRPPISQPVVTENIEE